MQINFDKLGGLVPAVIQHHLTGQVLMVGFMNAEAFAITVKTSCATFFSRTRNTLWTKGETSGHRLLVREIETDCDFDSVLIKVEPLGPGVCHEGYRTCFFRRLQDDKWIPAGDRAFSPGEVYPK